MPNVSSSSARLAAARRRAGSATRLGGASCARSLHLGRLRPLVDHPVALEDARAQQIGNVGQIGRARDAARRAISSARSRKFSFISAK